MTAQGFSRVAGGVAIAAVVVVTALAAWSWWNRSDREFTPEVTGGPALGDMTGYVGRVDREARTLEVSENMLGLRPIEMTVTNDTSITVQGRQGALGDLTKDMPVRVFYEVRNDVKYVTSLQVMTEAAQSTPAPTGATDAPPAAETNPAAEATPPAETPAPVQATSAPETKPPVESKAPTATKPPAEAKPPVVTVAPVTVAAPPATGTTPRPTPPAPALTPRAPARTPAQVAAPPPAPPARAAASTTESASVGLPRAAAPGPAEADDDGSAAVDWLLKGSGRP